MNNDDGEEKNQNCVYSECLKMNGENKFHNNCHPEGKFIYSAMKNNRITYSSLVFCLFSASLHFRWKQSLRDYMYLNMLYTFIKSDFSMLILSLRKQMFAEIDYYLPGKIYRINIIFSLFFHQGYFSFTLQLYIQKEKSFVFEFKMGFYRSSENG
jgi:hypothetical protein